MYCKQCGNLLGEGDKFCSNCGERVESRAVVTAPLSSPWVNHEEELAGAEEKVESMSSEPENKTNIEKPKRVFKRENFSWDLDGFPDSSNKSTEEVNFNWDSVMEEKMKLQSKAAFVNEAKVAEKSVHDVENHEEKEAFELNWNFNDSKEEPEADDQEDLESFLFKDKSLNATKKSAQTADEAKVDKFYTFNKKNEEFQALLDKEYEKLKLARGDGFSSEEPKSEELESSEAKMTFVPSFTQRLEEKEATEFEATISDEDLEEFSLDGETLEIKGSEAELDDLHELEEETIIETEISAIVSEDDSNDTIAEEVMNKEKEFTEDGKEVVAVTQPKLLEPAFESEDLKETYGSEERMAELPTTDVIDEVVSQAADLESNSESISQAVEVELEDDKPSKKKLTFDDIFNDDADQDSERAEKEQRKNRKVSNFVKVFFYLIVLLALVALGFKYFAKDSFVTQQMNKGYEYIASKLTGKSQPAPEVKIEDKGVTTIDTWVQNSLGENKNIGEVIPNQELKFINEKNYGFDDVKDAKPFENNIWYTDKTANVQVYYGDKIVEAVVKHFSDTAAELEEGSKMEKLEIGEIRTSEFGFFVLVKSTVTKGEENTTKVETVYLEPESQTLKISDVKEFTEGE